MTVPHVQMPRLFQTLQWILRPSEFMSEARDRLGDVFSIEVMGLGKLVLLSDPEDVREVFTSDPTALRGGEANAVVTPLLGPTSLLVLDPPDHLRTRQELLPSFSRKATEEFAPQIRRIAAEGASRIEPGRRFRIHDFLRRTTLRVMLTLVFGRCSDQRLGQFYRAFSPLTGEVAGALAYLTPLQRDLGPASPGRWFGNRIRALDHLIHDEIEARRAIPPSDQQGVLGALMRLPSTGAEPVGDAALRDHVVTLLTAGHETVGSALAWAFYWIHATPGVREQVATDLEMHGGDFGAARYLEAACLEALRITPVAEAVSRVATGPIDIGDFQIDRGSLVSPAIQLLHHRAESYPEPGEFRPQRFLEKRYKSYEYLPFGGGQRLCIGRTLALEEMKIVLGVLLSMYDFRLLEVAPPRAVRRNVTIAPKGGVPVVATRRP